MSELLQGVYDLHMHTSPDVVARKCSDVELAARWRAAGMAGGAIKSHYLDTAGRAKVLTELYPELDIAGGITLNRSVGGNNPWAVERSAQAGARMMWFATLEARAWQAFQHRNDPVPADLSGYLTVTDENGRLLPEVLDVLDAAAKYRLTVGTGHVGAKEGLELVREGVRRGLTMVLTHCDNPADCYTKEEQIEAARMGAVIEHSFFTTFYNRTPIGQIADEIRGEGVENVILTTDFGQLQSPYSDEGIELYMRRLMEQGFSYEELLIMVRDNPRRLIHP